MMDPSKLDEALDNFLEALRGMKNQAVHMHDGPIDLPSQLLLYGTQPMPLALVMLDPLTTMERIVTVITAAIALSGADLAIYTAETLGSELDEIDDQHEALASGDAWEQLQVIVASRYRVVGASMPYFYDGDDFKLGWRDSLFPEVPDSLAHLLLNSFKCQFMATDPFDIDEMRKRMVTLCEIPGDLIIKPPDLGGNLIPSMN